MGHRMRIRTFMAAALLVALLGFLGFRIIDLEQRVAALGQAMGTVPEATATQPDKRRDAAGSNLGYGPRLAALEKRVDAIQANVRSLEKATGTGAGSQQDDKEILSVVERENSRLRDVQLEWHRSRWLETRETQLMIFARQYHLSGEQTATLQKSLEQEVDSMVELLRRPALLEDPDQAASDWQAMLDQTDRAAKQVLAPEQMGAWSQARAFERQVLWPWLPNNTNK
jgi:hypothetical protein